MNPLGYALIQSDWNSYKKRFMEKLSSTKLVPGAKMVGIDAVGDIGNSIEKSK